MVKPLFIGLGIVSGIVLLSDGAIWYIKTHEVPVANVPSGGKPISLTAAEPATNATAASNSFATSTPKSTSSDLTVSSGDNQGMVLGSQPNSSNSTPNQIPGPDKFGQYDQYKDKTEALFGEFRLGDGIEASMNKTVTVNYKGWLTNGKEFDESYSKGQPFSFVVGQHRVIVGWEEAIIGMKVGGKRRFIVPPSVGYGSQETNGIPANSVLVFDVELLAVQ